MPDVVGESGFGAVPQQAQLGRIHLSTLSHRRTKPPRSSLGTYRKMEKDYAVALGLAIRKAPIIGSNWTVQVEAKDGEAGSEEQAEQIADSLDAQLRPIWRDTIKYMLTALSRKAAPFEKIFERASDGEIRLKRLKPVQLQEAELQIREEEDQFGNQRRLFGGMKVKARKAGESSGIETDQITVPWWKVFWFAWDASDGELVGESMAMECAKRAWWSKTSEDGLLDVEDLWFRKQVYDGVTVFYPEGLDRNGNDYRKIALEMGEESLAGGVVAIPVAEGQSPETTPWKIVKGESQKRSGELGKQIDDRADQRIVRALLVPPLVAGSQGETGTYALADVLLDVLLTIIEDDLLYCCQWLSKYVLQQLVDWNHGTGWVARIMPEPLRDDTKQLLNTIVQSLFKNSGVTKAADLVAILEKSGIPLKEDAEAILQEDQLEPAVMPQPPQQDPGASLQRDAVDQVLERVFRISHGHARKMWAEVRDELKKKSRLKGS